ncbi:hypothetical protein DFH29DRAFT_1003687 [Suillus ampliporus]|nr:hypothetical protein DFH29DRAFT_1003687 [Suillus ampliporus]
MAPAKPLTTHLLCLSTRTSHSAILRPCRAHRHLRPWDMTEGLVAGASAGPAGILAGVAQGASVFPPVAVGSTSTSLKATRDVTGRLTHDAGIALIVAGGPGGAVAGARVTRGVEGVLMHGAGIGANGVKAVTRTTAGVHAA